MSGLIDTTEMYLRTIYELYEEGIPAMRARISDRLHQSGPTVSQTVARMERDGLLYLGDDRTLRLTDYGWALATAVMRKHRLVESLLDQVIGLPWEDLHDEACRWEHVVSEDVERRLLEILDYPEESPYGNPTPGLKELRKGEPIRPHDPSVQFREGLATILDYLSDTPGPCRVEIKRISEYIQADTDLLRSLASVGMAETSVAVIARVPDGFSIKFDGGQGCIVDELVASGLFVAPTSQVEYLDDSGIVLSENRSRIEGFI